jgi:xylulokinase
VILTLDLGTTATKAALWTETGMVAIGRGRLTTEHPAPAWAEQDATSWWPSVLTAVGALGSLADVAAVVFTGARQTFVAVTAAGEPVGPAMLWSDRRVGSSSVLAKLLWLEANAPDRLAASRWLLSPRDLLAWRMGGELHTDVTLASASGLYGVDAAVVAEAATFAPRLPVPVPSATAVGTVRAEVAGQLGLPAGIPIVIGAGDRQCEVLGTGASREMPMVSWGTTANVSVPVEAWLDPTPPGLRQRRGALGGWVLEGGLSAAGSWLEWISGITGASVAELTAEAANAPPGARGVIALPWLGGARAPWWRDDVGAAFLGLGPGHGRADLARAALEGVALDVSRCLDAAGAAERLVLAGGGAGSALWADMLGGMTRLPVVRRRSSEAASVGAALVAAAALPSVGGLDVDVVNPVIEESAPIPALVEAYAARREAGDAAARAVLGDG